MSTQRWVARWIDKQGQQHIYAFLAPASRSIASIDFRLNLLDRQVPLPACFELLEVPEGLYQYLQRKQQGGKPYATGG